MTATTLERVNGLGFHVEQTGSGDPLVLIHGSWGSTARWALIVDGLARSFRVVNYDRRGHGRSESSAVPATRIDQEDDVAGLIETLGIGPAHFVGSSFGGLMSLSLASRRPDLVRSVSAHEPPIPALAPDDPDVAATLGLFDEYVALIHAGEREPAARGFVENLAIGHGAWQMLPDEVKQQMVRHADTFAGEMSDPDWTKVDFDGIRCPVLLTRGDSSPAWFTPLMDELAAAMPDAEATTIAGAGHVPHVTHPDEYVELVSAFAARAT